MDYFLFLKAVLDYIENRVAEELPVDEVAAAGFSPPICARLFGTAPARPYRAI